MSDKTRHETLHRALDAIIGVMDQYEMDNDERLTTLAALSVTGIKASDVPDEAYSVFFGLMTKLLTPVTPATGTLQ